MSKMSTVKTPKKTQAFIPPPLSTINARILPAVILVKVTAAVDLVTVLAATDDCIKTLMRVGY